MKLPDVDLFRPDKHRLDEELQEQPKLCRVYGDQLAEAQRELDLAEARLEFVEADLDKQIRRHPEDYGIDKVTETVIRREIVLHKRYQEAHGEVIKVKYAVNQLKGICNSVEHRKKSIESLVYLFGQSYWAEPRLKAGERKPVQDDAAARAFRRKQ